MCEKVMLLFTLMFQSHYILLKASCKVFFFATLNQAAVEPVG